MTGPHTTPSRLLSKRAAKILIIDDEPNVLSVLYTLLSSAHDCRTATSAIEAIEYLKEETYDLVLSDIVMLAELSEWIFPMKTILAHPAFLSKDVPLIT